MRASAEKEYTDLKNIGCPYLDNNNDSRHSFLLPEDVPLLSSPSAEAVLHMADTHEKRYPYLKEVGFCSLDYELACLIYQLVSVMGWYHQALHLHILCWKWGMIYPYLNIIGITFLDDGIELKHPNLLLTLLTSPPPAEAVLHMRDTSDEVACSISQSPDLFFFLQV